MKKIKIDVQKKLSEIKNLVKEVVEIEKTDPDKYPDQMDVLFELVEWFIDKNISNKIYKLINELNDDEIEVIDYLIKESIYRLEFLNEKGKTSILTPFAIPLVTMTKGEDIKGIESIISIPDTINILSSERLVRKGLDLGEEPHIIFDNRLWRMDLKEWTDHNAIIAYLESALGSLFQKTTFEPLTKINKKIINIKDPKGTSYIMFKCIIGFTISSNDMIDKKIFGDEENKDNNLMNEITILCEREFNKMGFEDISVCCISKYPIELFEVPLVADEFSLCIDDVIEEMKVLKGKNENYSQKNWNCS